MHVKSYNTNLRYRSGITYKIKKKVAKTANQSSQLGLRLARRTATKRSAVAVMASTTPTIARIKHVSCNELFEMSNPISTENQMAVRYCSMAIILRLLVARQAGERVWYSAPKHQ